MNKKIKIALAAVLAACALFNITGCSEKREQGSDLTAGDVKSPNGSVNSDNTAGGDENKGTNGIEVIKTQYAPITLSDNNTINSIRLFDAITADKDNAMFSPLSLNMALGLIEAGAKGETKAALDSYLQTENFTDFAENYMRLAREKYSSERTDGEWKNVLEIANSLWADHRVPLKDEYQRTMTERLGAQISNVSFKDKKETLDIINGWVSEKTHKMIPKAIGDYDEDSTAAMLINTVYFESAWRDRWQINKDNAESFTLPDGIAKELPLMYNDGDSYFENDKATAFSSRYMNGLEFIGILPKDEGEFTLEGLDIPALIESRSYDYDVTAVMPKLDFETSLGLTDALKAAGLENIFGEDSADFSGISEHLLFVTDILQNTKLELDENGTKAAAATVISMADSALPEPKERKTVRLDRSFAFMIYDSAEDQILFVGKVTNP